MEGRGTSNSNITVWFISFTNLVGIREDTMRTPVKTIVLSTVYIIIRRARTRF